MGKLDDDLEEHDFEIKPVNIVHGKGLYKVVIKYQDKKDEASNDQKYIWDEVFEIACQDEEDSLDEIGLENEAQMYEREILQIPTFIDSWYYELKYFLSQGACL